MSILCQYIIYINIMSTQCRGSDSIISLKRVIPESKDSGNGETHKMEL